MFKESGPGTVLGYFGNNSGTLARGTSSRPASRPGINLTGIEYRYLFFCQSE